MYGDGVCEGVEMRFECGVWDGKDGGDDGEWDDGVGVCGGCGCVCYGRDWWCVCGGVGYDGCECGFDGVRKNVGGGGVRGGEVDFGYFEDVGGVGDEWGDGVCVWC